ncbi:cytochrome P450 [Paenibacillus sp. Y412MC10]|nr:cytochrome P450 [Paenibacillus sp. Y412MC10]
MERNFKVDDSALRLSIPRDEVPWNFTLSSQGLAALPVAF